MTSDQAINRDEQTMGKLWLVLASFCVVPYAVHADRQETSTPPGGVLVQCGDEQIATFKNTTSKDGHYAVGWTIRAKGGKEAPAPWIEREFENPETNPPGQAVHAMAEPGTALRGSDARRRGVRLV